MVLVLVLIAFAPQAQATQEVWPPAGVVSLGPGVTPPRLVSQVQPAYTEAGMRRRIQGAVMIEFVVEVDGTPGPMRVTRSLDAESGLDEAAMVALRQWRFRPATRDGVPVRIVVAATLEFTLRGEPTPMAWPAVFPGAPSTPAGWVLAEVASGSVVVAMQIPPHWEKGPPAAMTAALWADVKNQRSVGVFHSQPAPPQLVLPMTAGRVVEFGAFMAKQFGAKASVRAEGQVTIAGAPWMWLDLDLNDQARAWSFMTTSGGQLVQVMCTVSTPSLSQTEAQRDEAVRTGAADCASILSSLRVTKK